MLSTKKGRLLFAMLGLLLFAGSVSLVPGETAEPKHDLASSEWAWGQSRRLLDVRAARNARRAESDADLRAERIRRRCRRRYAYHLVSKFRPLSRSW